MQKEIAANGFRFVRFALFSGPGLHRCVSRCCCLSSLTRLLPLLSLFFLVPFIVTLIVAFAVLVCASCDIVVVSFSLSCAVCRHPFSLAFFCCSLILVSCGGGRRLILVCCRHCRRRPFLLSERRCFYCASLSSLSLACRHLFLLCIFVIMVLVVVLLSSLSLASR